MPQKSSPAKKVSLAFRIAAAMQAMGIEGLPRNYELVYEVYTGSDADLVREFKALGLYRSQVDLDTVGRKYLPHHFAIGELEEQTGRIRDEIALLLGILEEEHSSLENYAAVVGRSMEALSTIPLGTSPNLGPSLKALNDGHALTPGQDSGPQ